MKQAPMTAKNEAFFTVLAGKEVTLKKGWQTVVYRSRAMATVR
jgi:hypothetical protein